MEPEVEIESDLSYLEHSVKVLDHRSRSTRSQIAKMCKVQWSNHTKEEATWETEDFLNRNYPNSYQKVLVRNHTPSPHSLLLLRCHHTSLLKGSWNL
jgi:hypothetical protein